MAKDKDANKQPDEPLTVERIRAMAETGQITLGTGKRTSEPVAAVKCLREFMDNGKVHHPGDALHMGITLIPRHVQAGVVELVVSSQ